MDHYNIEFTQDFISRIDQKLINEMDNITFEYNKLSSQGEKLLQILNYSPKVEKPDREQIKNLPKINIPQLSELKTLDFSILDAPKNKQNISPKIKANEIEDMIRNIINSIIDNIFEKYNINNINNIKIIRTDEEEDEEFEKIIIKNKKKSEDEEKKRDNEFENRASKIGLEMNLINQIKVYLFNNNDFILINISPKDKIRTIKEKIIKKIKDSKKYKLTNTSAEAYEIRVINEDNEDNFIMGSSPLENNDSLFKEKINTIAFLENQNYISEHINEDEDIKIEDNENEEKLNVKIYYKKNGIKNSKLLVLSKDSNLKNILNIFFEQNIFKNKNMENYFFVEHNEIQDIENEINLDTNIKYLPSYELNLCTKNYFEIPEIVNEDNENIKKSLFSKNSEIIKGKENSKLNEITAGLYQEFEVTKINKYKNKKKRLLGIDMYNLYNNLPKKSNSGLMSMNFRETKHPLRNIQNIKECFPVGKTGFNIDIKEEDSEQRKILKYETKNADIRDEIIEKINFLINYHKNNN